MPPTTPIKTKRELLAAIDANEAAHIALLQAFIQAASPNPPGDTRAAAKVLTDYLSAHDIRTTTIAPGGDTLPNIVSSFAACAASASASGTSTAGRNIVLNGHLDVFPVDANESSRWQHDGPWSGHYDAAAGVVYGRGGVDMKAGTLASTIAFRYLFAALALGGCNNTGDVSGKDEEKGRGSVTLTLVSDEETGGKFGSKHLLNEHEDRRRWRGDVMINAEPGGMQSIRFAEKGTLRVTFVVRTVGAHGAFVHLSEGANRVAARFVLALRTVEELVPPELPNEIREVIESEAVRKTMDEVMGAGAGALALKTTFNIGVMHGGVKVNTIPAECEVQADIRLPIGMTKEVVLAHIREHVLVHFPEVEMRVQEAASNPSSYCDPRHEIVGLLKRNAEAIGGHGTNVTAIPSLGGTDTKFWRYVGVPAYVYGVSPDSMAGIDERVKVDEFLKVIKVHAATVWDFLGGM